MTASETESESEDQPCPDASEPERSTLGVAELVDRYQGPLLAFAQQRLRDRHAAQDAVQETFLRLCRHQNQHGIALSADRVAAWLFTVCRSRIIDMQRKHTIQGDAAVATTAVDGSPPPESKLVDDEDRVLLAACIETLSPRQQEVLQLRLQAGLSYQQIAEVTGLNKSNVGFHLHAAMMSLRRKLSPSLSTENEL